MYTYEERIRAAKLYIILGKRVAATIRQLGYPTKNALKGWCREFETRLDLPVSYKRTKPKYALEREVLAVGHLIKPLHRTIRPRTRRDAASRLASMPPSELFEAANSYFGLLRQSPASHHHRAEIANVARRREHSVSASLTKAHRAIHEVHDSRYHSGH